MSQDGNLLRYPRKLTDMLITIDGRRGLSGRQLAEDARLRAFVAAYPNLFEPGPPHRDCVLLRECDHDIQITWG